MVGVVAVLAATAGTLVHFQERNYHTTDTVVQVLVFDKEGKPRGHGSGSYLGDGVYLTAAHVTAGEGHTFVIKHQNGYQIHVLDVRSDAERDVALLFAGEGVDLIPPVNLFCGYRGIGSDVYSKGYPMSLGLVETKGTIASVASPWATWKSVYRTDVALGPGMSGGPVFDAYGNQVAINIGMALMPLGFSASTMGLNLIVPTVEVCNFMTELKHDGKAF
jgi:serine protease Do